MHYKNIADNDLHRPMRPSKRMLDESDSSAVFGIQSVVIDGQCFYRLLDEQLNKALNEQFSVLKPTNSGRQPGHSKHISREPRPELTHSEPPHPHDPFTREPSFAAPHHHYQSSRHQFNDDFNLKLRVFFTFR